jgi:anti-anti-sigma factor
MKDGHPVRSAMKGIVYLPGTFLFRRFPGGLLMAKGFTTRFERKQGYLWITLPDSIDMYNYQMIEDRIMPELEGALGDVVLDLSRTKALFSSGIGLVIRLNKKICALGANLAIVNVDRKIREGLENVGLDRNLAIYATENDLPVSGPPRAP